MIKQRDPYPDMGPLRDDVNLVEQEINGAFRFCDLVFAATQLEGITGTWEKQRLRKLLEEACERVVGNYVSIALGNGPTHDAFGPLPAKELTR